MTKTEEKITASIVDKAIDFVEWICKDQRRDKMVEEKESLCQKCEDGGGELKCLEGDREFTIRKCENPEWATILSGREMVVECPDFVEKK